MVAFQLHQFETSPVYNIKSTLVSCPGTDKVFLYGGFDEHDNLDSCVYILDTKTMTWATDDKFKGVYREGHLAVYIGNGNVLVFGGITGEEEPHHHSTVSNKYGFDVDSVMLIYNIFQNNWISPPDFTLETCPPNRSRHACCLSPDGSKLYISGGLIEVNVIDKLYIYDFTNGSWQGPFKFVSRFDHFITCYDNKILSFGGLNRDMIHVMNKISYFDLDDYSVGDISLYANVNDIGHDYGFDFRNFAYNHLTTNRISDDLVLHVPINLEGTDFLINYYNLKKLKFVKLFTLEDFGSLDINGHYEWKQPIIVNDGIYFFGRCVVQDSTPELNLNVILDIKLTELGLVSNVSDSNTINNVSKDLLKLYTNQEFTDFEIYCLHSSDTKTEYQHNPEILNKLANSLMTNTSTPETNELIESIKVHKIVLLSRWPHFKRLIESGMNESNSNKMFIPEPLIWVKGLIHYLYTDNIDFDTNDFSIIDYSGLLILSNFYELTNLRNLTLTYFLEKLNYFQEVDLHDSKINIILKIFINILISNEGLLINKIIKIMKLNWSNIIKSEYFTMLPKPVMIKLVQLVTIESSKDIAMINEPSTPKRLLRSHSDDLLSSLNSPVRDCNSPFLHNSVRSDNLFREPDDSKLPALQHLSGILNDSIND